MTTATITETLALPADGSAATLGQTKVRLRLVAAVDGVAAGYTTGLTAVVEDAWTQVASSGLYSFTGVRPNSGASGDVITTPTGTVYELTVVYPSGSRVVRYLDVPDTAGPHAPGDILTVAPDAIVDSAVEEAIAAVATVDLADVTATAATAGQTLISDGTNYAPGQVAAAGLASNAVTTSKIAAGAVTSAKIDATVATAASVTSEAATRLAADTSLDLLKDDRIQGRRFGSPALTGWELAKAIGAFFPARVVFIRDSHGELGVDTEFNRIAARSRQQRVPLLGQSGHWVPAKATGFGALTHSGAVDASSGPGGWGATLSAGSWIQWGDGTNQDVTGWRFFGVGTFLIESKTAGGSVLESTTVTLAAGESWTSTSSTTYGFRQLRVTGSGAGGVAWGAFMALDNLSTGYQPWSFAHSGWDGEDILANTATWTMVDTLDPALVVIGMATNETDATAYRTNTEALIARARLTDADRSIALWFPHLASASGDDETWWDDAHTAFREMCVEHNCCPIDLYALWGDLSTSDPYGLIDTSDYVHLSALGNALASLIQASVLLDDAPGVRPVDATGVQPADTISFRNVSPGYSNVTLYAGNASSPGDYVTVARGGTWIPVAAGTPTIGQHLTTRAYVEGAFQPLDSDLTAIAALSTTSYGRSLLALADAAAGRTALGLGSLATASTITSSDITNGTIVNADISGSAAIDGTKVAYATSSAQGAVEFASGAEALALASTDRVLAPADAQAILIQHALRDEATGVVSASLPRTSWLGNITLVSGRIQVVSAPFYAGQIVSYLTFFSGTTPASAPTNQWFFIADSSRLVARFTSNDTSTAWAANTGKTLALTSSYTIPSTGIYYLGCMVSAGTPPNVLGTTGNATLNGVAPIKAGIANTGLTTVPSSPFTFAAMTAVAGMPMVWAS